MEYRTLGTSGMSVSRLCLGTMLFGNPTDAATSQRLVARAHDAGINFIDTADGYNGGTSEEIVGAAIKPNRRDWVLATKMANPMGGNRLHRGLSRRWMMEEIDNSLRRLGTDWVDVLYLHKEDHATPLEVTVRALGDMLRAGKIRSFGVSNYRSWRIAEICAICDRDGIDRPVVSQPYYNIMNRQPEVEQLPAAARYGLGIVPYSPLARGVLTGKYQPGAAPPEGTRAARKDRRMMETEWREDSLRIAQTLAEHAKARGTTVIHLAMAWLLCQKGITGMVVGPRTMDHLEDYLGAFGYRFTAEDAALVDSLVTPGHASTPRYNDPQYALEWRVTVG